jgi:hypothetical protein
MFEVAFILEPQPLLLFFLQIISRDWKHPKCMLIEC